MKPIASLLLLLVALGVPVPGEAQQRETVLNPPILNFLNARSRSLDVYGEPPGGVRQAQIEHYTVHWRRTDGGMAFSSTNVESLPYRIRRLNADARYEVYLTATNAAGESAPSRTLSVMLGDPRDYFAQDPLRLVGRLDLHRLYSLGEDRFAVWYCEQDGASTPTDLVPIDEAVSYLQEHVGDYFDWLSGGRYQPTFFAARTIEIDGDPLNSVDCVPDVRNAQQRLIDQGHDEYRSDGNLYVGVSIAGTTIIKNTDGSPALGIGTSGPTASHVASRIRNPTSLTPHNGRFLFFANRLLAWGMSQRAAGRQDDGVFVTVHEIGHTLSWPHTGTTDNLGIGDKTDVMGGGGLVGTVVIHRYAAGWIDPENVAFYDPDTGGEQTFMLRGIGASSQPLQPPVKDMVVIPTSQEGRYYTLGARIAERYDTALVSEGVEIHDVNYALLCPPLSPPEDCLLDGERRPQTVANILQDDEHNPYTGEEGTNRVLLQDGQEITIRPVRLSVSAEKTGDGVFTVTLSPATDVPSAPQNVSYIRRLDTVEVVWDPPGEGEVGISEYRVYCHERGSELPRVLAGVVSATGLPTYRHMIEAPDLCEMWVTAVGVVNGEGEASPLVAARGLTQQDIDFDDLGPGPVEKPDVPVIEAVARNEEIGVRWRRVYSGRATVTYVVRWSPPNQNGLDMATVSDDRTGFLYRIPDLVNGQEYTVTVTAMNRIGEAQSVSRSATPLPPPMPPRNLVLTEDSGAVIVDWDPPEGLGSENVTLTYTVSWRSIVPRGGISSASAGEATSYRITGLDANARYRIWIRASNVVGRSRRSEVKEIIIPASRPDAPDIRLTPGVEGILVSWKSVHDGGAPPVSYVVSWLPLNQQGFGAATGSYNSYRITDLMPGQEYTVTVAAANRLGQARSAPQSATLAAVPDPPQILVLRNFLKEIAGGILCRNGFQVEWETHSSGVLFHYFLMWEPTGFSHLRQFIGFSSTDEPWYAIRDASPNTEYSVWVELDGGGPSLRSDIRKITTSAGCPGDPTVVLTPGDEEIHVAWTPVSDGGAPPVIYTVEWFRIGRPGVSTRKLPEGSTTYAIPGLTNGARYTVAVTAANHVGGNRSAFGTVRVGPPLSPPQNVTLTNDGGLVTVAWDALSAAREGSSLTYTVYWQPGDDDDEATPSSQTKAVSPYDITGLDYDTEYRVWVTAVNPIGEGPRSEVKEITLSASPPGRPFISVGGEDGQLRVFWSPVGDGGAPPVTYTVEWGGWSAETQSIRGDVSTATVSGNSTTYVIRDLVNHQAYGVRVVAANSLGRTSGFPQWGVPGFNHVVTNVDLANIGRTVRVEWDPIGGIRDLFYAMYWQPTGRDDLQQRREISVDIGVVHYIPDLDYGTEYSIWITGGTSTRGEGLRSEIQTITIPSGPPTDPVIGLTPADKQISVAWTPVEDGGAPPVTYTVEWSPANQDGMSTAALPESSTTYTIPGLVNGREYTVTVTARNRRDSAQSVRQAAVPVGPPGPPQNVVVTGGDPDIAVEWDAPLEDGGLAVLSYRVGWAVPGLSDASLGVGGASRSSFIKQGRANIEYSVWVTAINAAGASARSEVKKIMIPPKAPGTPMISLTSGDGRIDVDWQAVADGGASPVTYTVEWSPPDENGLTQFTVLGNKTDHTIADLANGVEYTVTVTAANSADKMAQSAPQSTTPATTPGRPAVALAPGDRQIDVNWPAVDDGGAPPVIYTVEWSPPDENDSTQVTVPGTDHTISDLTNGVGYTVTVTAANSVGETRSAPQSTTPAATPGRPIVTVAPGNRQIDVNWQAVADGGAPPVTYTVSWSPPDENGLTQFAVLGNKTDHTITNLTNGVEYTVTVTAMNSAGETRSAPQSTTPATIPGRPIVTVVPGGRQIDVNWQAVDDGGAPPVTYTVSWSPPDENNVDQVTVPGTDHTITDLTNGVEYTVTVTARNRVGEVPSIFRRVTPVTRPQPPTLLSAAPGDTTIEVAWSAPEDTGGVPLTGYRVEWTSSEGTGSQDLDPDVLSYTITGLTNGTTYTVRVIAVNRVGESAASNAADALPEVLALPAPENLRLAVRRGSRTIGITAEWNRVSDPRVRSYILRWREVGSDRAPFGLRVVELTRDLVDKNMIGGMTINFEEGEVYEAWVVADTVSVFSPDPTSQKSADSLHHQIRAVAQPGTLGTFRPDVSASGGQYTVTWDETQFDTGGAVSFYYQIENFFFKNNSALVLASPHVIVDPPDIDSTRILQYGINLLNVIGRASSQRPPFSLKEDGNYPFGAPQNVAMTPGRTTVELNWDAPDDLAAPAGYTVSWQRVRPSEPTQSMQVTDTTFTIGGLLSSAIYEVWVEARNADGMTGAPSHHSQIATLPNAPADLAVSEARDGKAMVSWTAPSTNGQPITGYQLSWSPPIRGVSSLRVEASPYELVGLDGDTDYAISLEASNEVFDFSDVDVSTTVLWGGRSEPVTEGERPVTAPASPRLTSLTPQDGAIEVTWMAGDTGGETPTYRVVWTSADTTDETSATVTVSPYTIPGLTNGVAYTVYVTATNSAGTARSAEMQATPVGLPGAPANLSVVPGGSGELVVTWEAPADTGGAAINTYTIEWDTNAAFDSGDAMSTETAALSHVIAGLTNGTAYFLRVSATNSAGTGAASDTASATPVGAPDAPTNVRVVPGGSGELVVTWEAPADTGGAAISGYTVAWSPATADSPASVTGALTYTITGLRGGTAYRVTVTASNSAGVGAPASFAPVTAITVPAAPTIVSVEPENSGELVVTWNAPAENGGAQILDYTVTWTSSESRASTVVSGSPHVIRGLVNDTPYTVSVAARNSAGLGAADTFAETVAPMAPPPARLTLTVVPEDPVLGDLVTVTTMLSRSLMEALALTVRFTGVPDGSSLSSQTLPITIPAGQIRGDATFTPDAGGVFSLTVMSDRDDPMLDVSAATTDVTVATRDFAVAFLPQSVMLVRDGATVSTEVAVRVSPYPLHAAEQFELRLEGSAGLTLSGDALVFSAANPQNQTVTVTAGAGVSAGTVTLVGGVTTSVGTVTVGAALTVDVTRLVDVVFEMDGSAVTALTPPAGEVAVTVTTQPRLASGESVALSLGLSGDGLTLSSTAQLTLSDAQTAVRVTLFANEPGQTGTLTAAAVPSGVALRDVTKRLMITPVNPEAVELLLTPTALVVAPGGRGEVTLTTRPLLGTGQSLVLTPTVASDSGLTVPVSVTLAGGDQTQTASVSVAGNAAVGIRAVTLTPAANDLGVDEVKTLYVSVAETIWQQQFYIKASNVGEGDQFGTSLALSADGNVLAVGALREDGADDGSEDDAGAVYVFRRSAEGVWSQEELLRAGTVQAGARFGASVSLNADGTVLAAGADWESGRLGAVYVFEYDGAWSAPARLSALNAVDGTDDDFGASVALNGAGDVLVVGAPREDGDANSMGDVANSNDDAPGSGAAYVFTRSGSAWVQQGYLKASNVGAFDNFGRSVAVNQVGDVAVAGAPLEDGVTGGLTDQFGAVYVFRRNAEDVWNEEELFRTSDGAAGDRLGASVALNGAGDVLAAGAPTKNGGAGAAYIFRYDGAGWAEEAVITVAEVTGPGGDLGRQIALDGTGDVLAVGAPLEDTAEDDSGAVYLFRSDGNGEWSEEMYVKASNAGAGDRFGRVALSGDGILLAAGATHESSDLTGAQERFADNDNVMNTGAVYLIAGEVGVELAVASSVDADEEVTFRVFLSNPLASDLVLMVEATPPGDGAEVLTIPITVRGGEIFGVGAFTPDVEGDWNLSVASSNNVLLNTEAATATVRVGIVAVPPGAPENVNVVPGGSGELVVTWGAPANNGGAAISGYTVAWSPATVGSPASVTGALTYTITGLTGGTDYTVTVAASNSAGAGAPATFTPVTAVTVPGAPTLTLTPGDERIEATWTAAAGNGAAVSAYTIEWDTNATFDSGSAMSTETAALSHVIAGLTNGTAYFVRVSATNSVGRGAADTASATPVGVPGVPTNVRVVPGGSGELVVTWNAPTENGGAAISGYTVAWSPATAGSPADVGAEALTYTITGLDNGATYEVWVTAVNRLGQSERSNGVMQTPAGAPEEVDVNLTPGDATLQVTWDVPGDGGRAIVSYTVFWQAQGRPATRARSGPLVAGPYSISGLINGAAYEVWVIANNGLYDSPVPASPVSAVPDGTLQTVPNVRAARSADHPNALLVSWEEVAFPATYTVRWTPSDGAGSAVSVTAPYTITGLIGGVAYMVEVIAISIGDPGLQSAPSAVEAIPFGMPQPPVLTQEDVVVGDGVIRLSWEAAVNSGGAGIIGYTVYWQTGTDRVENSRLTPVSRYTITGLDNDSEYTVWVTASNFFGESERSQQWQATPGAPLSAPRDVRLDVSDLSQVTISYSAPESMGASGISAYRIYLMDLDSRVTTFVTTPDASTLSVDVPVCTAGMQTCFRVGAAYDIWVVALARDRSEGPESRHHHLQLLRMPQAPAMVMAVPSYRQIEVRWQALDTEILAGGGHIIGYIVEWRREDAEEDTAETGFSRETSYTIRHLDNGSTYVVTVQAVGTNGLGTPSPVMEVRLPDTSLVVESIGLEVTSDDRIRVSWAGLGDGVQYAVHWRRLTGPRTPSQIIVGEGVTGVVVPPSERTPETDQSYTVWVTASLVDSFGDVTAVGPRSPIGRIFVPGTPQAPRDFRLVYEQEAIRVTWQVPGNFIGNEEVLGYKVYWRGADTGDPFMSEIVDAQSFVYTITGLSNGTEYEVYMVAVHGEEEGAETEHLMATPENVPVVVIERMVGSDGEEQIIRVSWEPVAEDASGDNARGAADHVQYIVYWQMEEQPDTLSSITTTETNFTFPRGTLMPGVSYLIWVVQVEEGFEIASAQQREILPESPGAPRGLLVVNEGDRFVDIEWLPPPDNGGSEVTFYRVYWQETTPDVPLRLFSTTIATVGTSASTQTHTVAPLENGLEYAIRVSAINNGGADGARLEGPLSSTVTATSARAPDAPNLVDAVEGNRQLTVEWEAPVNDGGAAVTAYTVVIDDDRVATLSSTVTDYVVTGLTNGQTYTVGVIAANRAGESGVSNTLDATPATVPSAPDIRLQPGDGFIEVSWDAPSANGAAIEGYRVEWDEESGDFASPTSNTVASLSYRIESLTNGTAYQARVVAINAVGESAPSVVRTATPATVPGAPTNVMAERGDERIIVRWTPPSVTGGAAVTSYTVTVTVGDVSTPTTVPHMGGSNDRQTVTIMDLVNGTAYEVTVVAINRAGEGPSAVSDPQVVVPATVPDAPVVTLAPDGLTIVVSWMGPNSNGEAITRYRVEWRESTENLDVASSEVITVLPDSTDDYEYRIEEHRGSPLVENTEYIVRVYAINAVGESSLQGRMVMLANRPGAPTLTSLVAGNGTLTVAWTAPVSDGGTEIIQYIVVANGERVATPTATAKISPQTQSETLMNLMNGTSYTVMIIAVSSVGESLPSAAMTVTPATVPDAPTTPTLTAGEESITISWRPSVNDGGATITSYTVTVSAGGVSTPTTVSHMGDSAAEQSTTVMNLVNDVEYQVTVTAINRVGESAPSPAASATPRLGAIRFRIRVFLEGALQ